MMIKKGGGLLGVLKTIVKKNGIRIIMILVIKVMRVIAAVMIITTVRMR